jgi:hypothetical protein
VTGASLICLWRQQSVGDERLLCRGRVGERRKRVEPLLMLRARSLSISACGFLGPWRNHDSPPSSRSIGASGGYSAPAALQRNARRKSANAEQGRGRRRHTRARGRSAGVGFRVFTSPSLWPFGTKTVF